MVKNASEFSLQRSFAIVFAILGDNNFFVHRIQFSVLFCYFPPLKTQIRVFFQTLPCSNFIKFFRIIKLHQNKVRSVKTRPVFGTFLKKVSENVHENDSEINFGKSKSFHFLIIVRQRSYLFRTKNKQTS